MSLYIKISDSDPKYMTYRLKITAKPGRILVLIDLYLNKTE